MKLQGILDIRSPSATRGTHTTSAVVLFNIPKVHSTGFDNNSALKHKRQLHGGVKHMTCNGNNMEGSWGVNGTGTKVQIPILTDSFRMPYDIPPRHRSKWG